MKTRIISSITATTLLFTNLSYAVAPGFYMGLMTGPASNTGTEQEAQVAPPGTGTTPAFPKSKQWGTRFFSGNKVTEYFGWELGASFYSTTHYNTQDVDTCSGMASRVRTVEFLGKGSFPFKSVDVFGKAGVAVAYTTTPGALYGPDPGQTCGDTRNDIKFRPEFAIGASYDMSQSWVIDASWTRTMIGGFISNVDLYAIGISYHFVDRYCGQFLCDY